MPNAPSAVPPPDPAPAKIAAGDVPNRIFGLGPGHRLTLIGIDLDGIGDALRTGPPAPRAALLLEAGAARLPEGVLDRLLDDLAALALHRWPAWYGVGASDAETLLDRVAADPIVSLPWLRAAARRAEAGRPPRPGRLAKAAEFKQLMHSFAPAEPVLIAAPDPVSPARAAPVIQVMEWCAAHGAAVVATFAVRPSLAAPYERVLYGALEVVRQAVPVESRFIGARAHHASAIEQRLEAALRRDAELGPLFSCNETVPILGFGSPPRVDLLWRAGRIVVELDGPDHQADPKFANDRHRDYELLVSGYLVLRLTNSEIETDLQRAIEKIRAVVRFRQSEGEKR